MAAQPPIPASLWNSISPEAQAAILALVTSFEQRIAELEAENADLRRRLAQVEHQLQKIRLRGKRPSHRRDEAHGPRTDHRRKEHRHHPGSFRPEPPPGTVFIEHDVRPQQCTHCGAHDLESTGQFQDHFVADLPEPKLEWHRYRRYIYRCRCCQRTCQGRGDLELPGSHIGPRARLLTCYSRAHLGISLGKTRDLLHDFFGLTISRAGLLGHLRWAVNSSLRSSTNSWNCFVNPPWSRGTRPAGGSTAGPAGPGASATPAWPCSSSIATAVATCSSECWGNRSPGRWSATSTRRTTAWTAPSNAAWSTCSASWPSSREELPWQSVKAFIQPLIDLFRDAIQLGKDREELGPAKFHESYKRIIDRFDDLMLKTRSQHPDCVRIWKRLYKHCDELFTFLDDPAVPADNNGTERDIRSLAAARNDGGTHRADWSAAAFARLKSVIVTGMKNQVRFIQYGIEVVRAKLRGERLPLPLAATPDTS